MMTQDYDAADIASWPNRIVYVCSAGGAANVNVVPMLHAGAGRVVCVLVLLGLSDPDNPTDMDTSQAVDPARRICDYARSVLGLSDERIKLIRGNTDLISDWLNVAGMIDGIATELDAEIVFNITGGRVATKMGFVLSLAAYEGRPISLISVGLDHSVQRVDLLGRGEVRERPLPVDAHITIDDYMRTFGFEEHSRKARQKKQTDYLSYGEPIGAIKELMMRDSARYALGYLMSQIAGRDFPELPVRARLNRGVVKILRPVVNELAGCVAEKNEIVIKDQSALNFLRGHWLEAAVYREAVNAFRGRNDVEILANYEPRRIGGPQEAETDFDLMVLGNDNLILVECKAIVKPNKEIRQAINKLANYRAKLSGHGGAAFLIAPLLSEDDFRSFDAQVVDNSVKVIVGPRAIDELIIGIKKLIR